MGQLINTSLSLNGNESILDLGCGDGVLTEQLSKLVPQGNVLGIDASESMIQSAKKLENENLSFICMNINQIDFANRFDIIYSNAALHWIKDHENLLKNCIEALKPNGYIAWNFAADGTCINFNTTLLTLISSPEYRMYFDDFEWPWYMPKIDNYLKLISLSNFCKYDSKEENKDRYFENSDELIKWIDQPSLVPFICRIPDEKKDIFRNEVIETMLIKTLLPDKRCFETFRRINIVAYKQGSYQKLNDILIVRGDVIEFNKIQSPYNQKLYDIWAC